eukprot:scaffold13219_cov61-Attheya_sp.AAC.3
MPQYIFATFCTGSHGVTGPLREVEFRGYFQSCLVVRLLTAYWSKQKITAKASGYHEEPFTATPGVTQGDPVSPTIFNIVINVVVCYWLSLVCREDITANGLGYDEVKERRILFYANDDGLLSLYNREWVQESYDVLIGIFEHVGLRMNASKTKYHLRVQHGRQMPQAGREPAPAVGLTTGEYIVSFPKTVSLINCPIKGCPGKATSRAYLHTHFMHRHVKDTLIILDEGTFPHPRCDHCGMFVPRPAVYTSHPNTAMCKDEADPK